jgi:insertion element IS1 protein InsB
MARHLKASNAMAAGSALRGAGAQRRGLASELDDMWAYVARKTHPRWRWHAMDHDSGKGLASVFRRRQDTVFLELQGLLAPFGITRFSTDGWGTYKRPISPAQPVVGKQHTQNIESKHINLRTRIQRLVRRTVCFSKTPPMPDLVVGLFINRYEFE